MCDCVSGVKPPCDTNNDALVAARSHVATICKAKHCHSAMLRSSTPLLPSHIYGISMRETTYRAIRLLHLLSCAPQQIFLLKVAMFQLAATTTHEIEIKKSRFIGHLLPVTTRAEAMRTLADLRAAHPGAVHFCWVLMCEGDSGLDDDGEPSGTAARPMYNVLVHKQLFNVLAVVVRYWGGIKLGAGGLTRAYGQAISEAVKEATLIPVELMCERRFVLSFADESTLRRLLEQEGAAVIDATYADTVTLTARIKASQADAFCKQANDLLRGNLQVMKDDAPD